MNQLGEKMLSQWLNMRIQLYEHCFDLIPGKRIHGSFSSDQLPTFEEFKRTYDNPAYSMAQAHYKESLTVASNGDRFIQPTQGLGTVDGLETRYFNYFLGKKYYID